MADIGTYKVRIVDQIIEGLTRDDVERRSKLWLKVRLAVDVASSGSEAYVPLAKFLASTPKVDPREFDQSAQGA
jgi:hypothetical protein